MVYEAYLEHPPPQHVMLIHFICEWMHLHCCDVLLALIN